ncbi:2-polyprenylphenol 6-hydroxylase [Ehrlichia canis]|uniref:2-octaprenylphenol hydroxylase n=1 Tax=Ehrlichia canis (strain Jake) TaxID=269484 RepID=A0ACA6AVG5_EHRCJ|nr:2-polyprenylphenol 6-hydroxylase [Ehrlichia canis]AAZ68297.1 2-octaprenylphenol hydroxylase [Ehrlichia canis str. Jake]AUO54942.1 2-polyprenylphenol 6-hydroxylase [Ehrlichia canis]UKC53116.1 ubiB [Ehrlichia canis]UKC54053.1 ubiB [Ehrlichia canis]UKC54989.1 ubiB [Ehrlichia canis]
MLSIFSSIISLLNILSILVRYNVLPYTYFFADRSIRRKSQGERVTMALQRLGPIFIKFGQSMSSRADIIGEEIANHLLCLCDKLPAFPYADVVRIIEEDFKCNISEMFCEFEQKPIAAASIAQVHKAKDIDGNVRAVKVLRPKIEKIFERDIKLMFWLARLAQYFSRFRRFQLLQLVQTFREICRMEIDLRFEAANAEELRSNIQDDDGCYVPEVDWTKTTRRVLTLEWVDAVPIYSVYKSENCETLVRNLIFCFCNQVYRDRFFHADMHPGNLMVDTKGRIVIIDFGIVGRLDKATCMYVTEILVGFLKKDYQYVADIHYRAGYVDAKYSSFITACRAIGEPIVGKNAENISISMLLTQLFKITSDFDMKLQPQLFLLQKTTVLVEGVCRQLCPEINMWKVAELWMEKYSIEKNKYIQKLKRSYICQTINDIPSFMKKVDKSLDVISNYQELNKANIGINRDIIWALIVGGLIIKLIIG